MVSEKLGVSLEQAACMGDDLNDLPMMELCGFAACPGNAVQAIRERCGYVCNSAGGHGAVREFIDWLIENDR